MSEHSAGGLFELEVTREWEVVDLTSGRVVLSLSGGYSASYDGVGWGDGVSGGVVDVVVTADERFAEVHRAGGHVERVPLGDAMP